MKLFKNRKKRVIRGIDLFCGGGGFSSGFLRYLKKKAIAYIWQALNHSPTAIATHKANFPEVKHLPYDIYEADPLELVPGGFLDILIASPSCTHHSNAKGGGVCDEQSRCQSNKIIDWAKIIDISAIVLENVKEFMSWGPLLKRDIYINGKFYEKGERDPRKKGIYFRRFIRNLKKLGYKVEHRILNSADYGAHTARNRFFLIATKGKQAINWPVISHAKKPEDFFIQKHKPARDIIDWSIKGESIFRRQAGLILKPNGKPKPPLSANTIRRICYGLKKFSGFDLDPYLVMLYGQSNARALDLPLPTITNGNHLALCTPYFIDYHGTGKVRSIDRPLNTINTSGNHLGLIEPYLIQYHAGPGNERRCYSLNNPLPVVDTVNRYAVCEPFITKYYTNGGNVCSINDPLATVPTKDRFSLIQPVTDCYQLDILYRMLEAHELAAAMGFTMNYKFCGTKTDVKKQIGNAVEVNQAEAMASAVIPELLIA